MSSNDYIRQLKQDFDAAFKSHPQSGSFDCVIAGIKIRILFVGGVLVPVVCPALGHLAVTGKNDSEPDVTIGVWVGPHNNTPNMPSWYDETKDSQWRHHREGEKLVVQRDITNGITTLNLYDRSQKFCLYWINDLAGVPDWEKSAPLRNLFQWLMSDRGMHLVHGAAVGLNGRGVLLVGMGGSGKSTTALSCLNSELMYVGDDYLLVDNRSLKAHSLYSTGKLKPDSLSRLSFLHEFAAESGQNDQGKRVLFFNKHLPHKIGREFDISAILIPRVRNTKETSLESAPSVAALKALAPSTIFQLSQASGSDHSSLIYLTTLVKSVPSFYMNLGSDMSSVPQAIINFLNTSNDQAAG